MFSKNLFYRFMFLLLLPLFVPPRQTGCQLHEDADNTSGVHDSTSWGTTYNKLQNTLAAASRGGQI